MPHSLGLSILHLIMGGYLVGQPPLDAVRLLPPPPAAGSSQEAFDRAAAAASRAGVDGPAWKAAIREANIPNADFMQTLSCAVGVQVSAEKTPAVQKLFTSVTADFIGPMEQAKSTWKRPRPFTVDGGPACDARVAAGGCDLREQRGLDCRVHWTSDVAAGRMLGLALYQRISATPAYQADVKAAAAEIAKAPPIQCPAG
mgnify:CR=1 FL=1